MVLTVLLENVRFVTKLDAQWLSGYLSWRPLPKQCMDTDVDFTNQHLSSQLDCKHVESC